MKLSSFVIKEGSRAIADLFCAHNCKIEPMNKFYRYYTIHNQANVSITIQVTATITFKYDS